MVKKEVVIKKEIAVKKESVSKKSNRSSTGIEGFDELVEGGFPDSSSVLICGGPGTGKSIFCMQYLVNGVEKFNEKGLFVSFEQREDAIIEQGKQFGWDLEELQKKGKIQILSISVDKINQKTIEDIKKIVNKEGIKRLVIDSLSTLIINAPIYETSSNLSVRDVVSQNVVFSPPIIGDYIVKRFVYGFIDHLRELNCTSLLIGEAGQGSEYISRDGLSEFVCDGVVIISFESLGGNFSRSLMVRKMRQTKNDEDVHPMEISKKGVIIHKIG